MRSWKLFFLVLALSLLASSVIASDFPYVRAEIRTPPVEDPFPGIGTNWSTLSKGIDTVTWNPASLAKMDLVQTSLSLNFLQKSYSVDNTYQTSDETYSIGDADSGFGGMILFTDDQTTTIVTTREHTAHSIYQTVNTGINFKQALRINDTYAIGIISRGGAGIGLDINGQFPGVNKIEFNVLGKNNVFGSGFNINDNGFLTYTVTPEGGGSSYTYTTRTPLWSGFTSQESVTPLTIMADAANDINIDSSLTFSGAGKWGNLCVGMNVTPISGTCNINNYVRAVTNSESTDMNIYVPNFSTNEASTVNWISNDNQYATENGYTKNTIRIPAGETVAEARYNGSFTASTIRMDLGATYDFGEAITLGMALENFNGATLAFKGEGRAAYVQHRISTSEPNVAINPGQPFDWSPFSDTFAPMKDTEEIGMPETINIALPQRMRFGIAFKKPFLICIDYETQQNPVYFRYKDENSAYLTGKMANVTYLRLGGETQVFKLPMWLRGGTTLLFKPNFSDIDDKTQKSIDDAFAKVPLIKALPVKLDLGTDINFWGTLVGGSFGVNGTSALNTIQIDTLNMDFSKLLFYDLYATKGPWTFKYMAVVDPTSTAGAYKESGKASASDLSTNEIWSILRWIQTVTISYNF